MPTRVLLEGPAIEPLLAQVREEYGSGVRIISADKVRSGGFGGFFAKQHYELSVEVPDTNEERKNMANRKAPTVTVPTPPSAAEAPAQSLDQLLERAGRHDRIAGEDKTGWAAGAEDKTGWAAGAEDKTGRAAGAEDKAGRAAGAEDTEAAAAAERRERSDNAAAFAELMAGLDAANHISTAAPHRPAPRAKAAPEMDDSPTVRPFRPATATGSPINSGGGVKPPPPVPSLSELMGGLGVSEADTPAFQPAKPPPVPTRSAASAYGLNEPAREPDKPTPPASTLRSVHTDPVISNLISVGMPEAMAAQIVGGDTYAGVLTALASRPSAPGVPDGRGEILVLAGDVHYAVPISKDLLAQTGIDPSHLLLGGPSAAGTGLHSSRVIQDPKAAAARAERLQSAESAWVVVLDAPVGGTDPIWVNDMCDALGATAVWALVDATRKIADTARHLRTLGEVEAVVVHNVELTADPATVLGLDLPIVSLDGKPATPHAWAAMLCARIAADVMPPAAAPRRSARSAR